MKSKLICTAILALASFNAAAQDAAADANDQQVCRVLVCDKSVSASEAAFERSMLVFQLRRQLGLISAVVAGSNAFAQDAAADLNPPAGKRAATMEWPMPL